MGRTSYDYHKGLHDAETYISEALALVGRLDPDKGIGQELAEKYARLISVGIYKHNQTVLSGRVPGSPIDTDYHDRPLEYFRDAGFEWVDKIRLYIDTVNGEGVARSPQAQKEDSPSRASP